MQLAGWLAGGRTDGQSDSSHAAVVRPVEQRRTGAEERRRCRGGNSPTRSRSNVSFRLGFSLSLHLFLVSVPSTPPPLPPLTFFTENTEMYFKPKTDHVVRLVQRIDFPDWFSPSPLMETCFPLTRLVCGLSLPECSDWVFFFHSASCLHFLFRRPLPDLLHSLLSEPLTFLDFLSLFFSGLTFPLWSFFNHLPEVLLPCSPKNPSSGESQNMSVTFLLCFFSMFTRHQLSCIQMSFSPSGSEEHTPLAVAL